MAKKKRRGSKGTSPASARAEKASKTRTCPSCHKPIDSGAKFCRHCGRKVPPSKAEKRKTGPEARPTLSLDRVLLYALSFTLFALPLFFMPGITEYGYGKTIFALVAVSVLTVLWGIGAWRKGEWRIRAPWIAFPFLAFVVAGLLSLIGAINGRVVIQSLVLAVFFFQFVVIIASVVREKRDVTLLLFSILASASLISLYGLLQYLEVLPGAAGARGLNRIIGTLGNRNFLGGFLGYLLLPSFALVFRLRSPLVRIPALFMIAFDFGTLMLVQQLAPIVGLIAAAIALVIGLILFRPIEPIRRNRRWLIGLLALLALTFLIEAPSGPLNSVVGLSQDGSSGEPTWIGRIWRQNSGRTRELDWSVALEMLKARPITGVGLGNYKLAFLSFKAAFLETSRGSTYADLQISRAAQAHGDYVQVAAELGGLGILILLCFLGVLAVSIWRRLRQNRDEADRLDILLFSSGLIVFLVHALVSFPAHLPTSMMMVLVLLGLIHAPAYGETSVTTVRLKKRGTMVTLAVVTVVGVVVSVFALSDLRANMLMGAGIQKLQLGEVGEGRELLERSIRLDFAPRQTYYHLATVHNQLGNHEEALANYEKCFTRFVDEAVYLIYADTALSLGRLEDARAATEFLLSTNPKSPTNERARYIEAMISIQLRDYAGAKERLEALTRDAPDFELPWIALGNLHKGLGAPDLAREAYEKALDLIDERLAEVESRLAPRTRLTASEYSELTGRRTSLQNERSFVLERLAELDAD